MTSHMPNTNKPESMEEHDMTLDFIWNSNSKIMAYNILRALPIDVIRDFMWENDYDWVINIPLRKEKEWTK